MKLNRFLTLSGATSATAMIACANAQASYQHLLVTSSLGAPNGRITYRVYATFSDENDYLTAVSGSVASPLHVQSRNGSDTGPGSDFFENDSSAFDTWLGIGVSPGMSDVPGFIIGNEYISSSVIVSTPGPQEQGRAGWLGDGDPALRVMFMQLTVSSTSSVRGTVNIAGINNIPLAGGQPFELSGQTFNSIPAPGCLVLLTLAGLMQGSRRRRVVTQSGRLT